MGCRFMIALARPVQSNQGLATCHTLLNPSPVLSPGLLSLNQKYSGLPLKAHCFLPSSRFMTVKSPDGRSVSAAISGGQLVAQGPLQTDFELPATSLSN